jgi:2',3'-cyclic-nucleotide 2'-phosphodiesterase (5'-nucleotidase family)
MAAMLAMAMSVGLAGAQPSGKPVTITFVHLNDTAMISPKNGSGGLAEAYALVKAERQHNKNTIFTFGGDLLSPSILSSQTKGAHMVDLMNAMKLDMATFGNHEFDFGADVLRQRIQESSFKWVSVNVRGRDGAPFGKTVATTTIKIGGIMVGFLGVTNDEASIESDPDIRIVSVGDAVRTAVQELKNQGAQVIVGLTHLHLDEDRALLKANPDIKLILGGYDPDPVAIYENGGLILKSGSDAQFVGAVDLRITIARSTNGVETSIVPSWRIIGTAGIAPDPGLAQRIKTYQNQLDRTLNQAIATIDGDLDSRHDDVRTRETSMGDVVTDALLARSKADVALVDGGSISGDALYKSGTRLTRRDVLKELPLGNVLVIVELSGKNLAAALENGVSKLEEKDDRFPQVAGLSFTYDPQRPAGQRIVEIKVGGQELDPNTTYRIATTDFLLQGGDGYDVFKGGKVVLGPGSGPLIAVVVADYIAAQSKLTAKTESRITVLGH